MAFPGFNNKKRSSISSGDWDRDGVSNRKDCEPLNFRKQGPEHKNQEEYERKFFAQRKKEQDDFDESWEATREQLRREKKISKETFERNKRRLK